MAKQKRKLVSKELERVPAKVRTAPSSTHSNQRRIGWRVWLTLGISWSVLVVIVGLYIFESRRLASSRELKNRTRLQIAEKKKQLDAAEGSNGTAPPTRFFTSGNLTLVWDKIKPEVKQLVSSTSTSSNIARKDFAGSQRCAECHKANYAEWSEHPHRWMNALADEQTIKGNFAGDAELRYRGGVAKFYREGDKYRMRFDRADLHREY